VVAVSSNERHSNYAEKSSYTPLDFSVFPNCHILVQLSIDYLSIQTPVYEDALIVEPFFGSTFLEGFLPSTI
jgi:hypothetical protein